MAFVGSRKALAISVTFTLTVLDLRAKPDYRRVHRAEGHRKVQDETCRGSEDGKELRKGGFEQVGRVGWSLRQGRRNRCREFDSPRRATQVGGSPGRRWSNAPPD